MTFQTPNPVNVPGNDNRLLSDGSNHVGIARPFTSPTAPPILLSGVWQLNYTKGLRLLRRPFLEAWELGGSDGAVGSALLRAG